MWQTSLFSAKAQPGNMLITSTDKVRAIDRFVPIT